METINNIPAIRLYKFEGETYCKMIDVLRMIHHEFNETDSQSVRSVLSRMKFRLVRNDLCDPRKGAHHDNTCIPGRYAVAWKDGISFMYYAGKKEDDKSIFVRDYEQAKMYVTYREASAVADFLDSHDCSVLDMHDFMSEADRFRRALYIPYNADEGNENAIVPDFLP